MFLFVAGQNRLNFSSDKAKFLVIGVVTVSDSSAQYLCMNITVSNNVCAKISVSYCQLQ